MVQYLAWKGIINEEVMNCKTITLPHLKLEKNQGSRLIVRNIAIKNDDINILPTYDLFIHENDVKVLENNFLYYLDDGHLTNQGASLISDRLERKIKKTFLVKSSIY